MIRPAAGGFMRGIGGYSLYRVQGGVRDRYGNPRGENRRGHGGVLGSLLNALLKGGSAKADERAMRERAARMKTARMGVYPRVVMVRDPRTGRIIPMRAPPAFAYRPVQPVRARKPEGFFSGLQRRGAQLEALAFDEESYKSSGR
jgi:hypothetical protein